MLLGVFIYKSLNCEELVILTYEVFEDGCMCGTCSKYSSQLLGGVWVRAFTNTASRTAVANLCRQAQGLAKIDGMVAV